MGGVVIEDTKYSETCKIIQEFKKQKFPELFEKNQKLRLHASDLVNCRGDFSGFDKQLAIKTALEFYQLIREMDFLLMISAVIDKQKLVDRYKDMTQDPYIISWLYCCDRFNMFLREKNEEKGKTVVESRGAGLDKLYKTKLESSLSYGTKFRWIQRVDNPEFDTPLNRPPLEIADFVCYALHKSYNKNENNFLKIIEPRFRCNNKGRIPGFGIVEFPK